MGAQTQGRPRWPWILGGFAAFCLSLVLVIGLGTGIGPYDIPARSRELDKVIAESKRLGLPMTAAELTGPPPPEVQNAAPIVLAAAHRLGRVTQSAAFYSQSNDPKIKAQQDAWFAGHDADLDEIVVALSNKSAWYVDRDYDMSFQLLFPELSELKLAAKMLALRSELRAVKGEVDSAISDFRARRDLSNRLAREPYLIGLLVSVVVESVALRSIERFVDDWRTDPRKLAALESSVSSSFSRKDPTIALRGEYYFAVAICRNLKKFGGIRALSGDGFTPMPPPPRPSDLQRTGLPHGMFERASLAVVANEWNKVFARLQDPSKGSRDWSAPMRDFDLQTKRRFRASEVLAQVLLPVYTQAEAALARCDAYQSLALAFVRAFRFKAEKGRWPASLHEIGSDFPDPFNPGNPIQAKFSDKEVRVWSIGPNNTDDGGQWRDAAHQKADDPVFLWPPSLRTTSKQDES